LPNHRRCQFALSVRQAIHKDVHFTQYMELLSAVDMGAIRAFIAENLGLSDTDMIKRVVDNGRWQVDFRVIITICC